MEKRVDKKGQFYLIAAIVIVIIVLGMAGVTNYISVKDEPKDFYDIGENLGLEGAWVIDQGVYTNIGNLNERVEEFAREFAEYVAATGEDFELVVAYGSKDTGKVKRYSMDSSGGVESELGTVPTYKITEAPIQDLSNVNEIIVEDTKYDLDVKENENFLFVLTTSRGFEKYVYENLED